MAMHGRIATKNIILNKDPNSQQRYSAFTATFCEVGCILAWTPITESKVLNYVLIAESTVSSTGAGLAASLSFGETSADLLGMVGDNPFHSI